MVRFIFRKELWEALGIEFGIEDNLQAIAERRVDGKRQAIDDKWG